MFEPESRYYTVEETTATLPDGRTVTYKRRRFLPRGSAMPLLGETTVAAGERVDLITHRTLGNAEQFWRICDANDAMVVDELEVADRVVRIPAPQGTR